jgi:hypothetical protein
MEQYNTHIGDPCVCGSNRIYYAEEDGSPWQRNGRVWYEKCPDCGSLYWLTYPLAYYEGEADPFRTLVTEQ